MTALGFFDAGGDGLFDAHDVGIFAGDGTLLASTTVPSGAGAALRDGFRFVSIPGLVLGPGTYRIGAQGDETSLDDFQFGRTGSASIEGLALGAGVFGFGSSLVFPGGELDYGAEGFFGPNFQASTVPEPATLALTAIGLAGAWRRRRRRSAKS